MIEHILTDKELLITCLNMGASFVIAVLLLIFLYKFIPTILTLSKAVNTMNETVTRLEQLMLNVISGSSSFVRRRKKKNKRR